MSFIEKNSVKIGFFTWLIWSLIHLPHPLENQWGKLLVLFAPLVVVPLVFDILKNEKLNGHHFSNLYYWQLPAAFIFTLAYSFPQNMWTGALSLPWFVFTLVNFIFQLNFWRNTKEENKWLQFILTIAAGFLVVGSSWAIFDRFGIRPLGYDPEIVFLTVAHFHYAGYVLPIVAALMDTKLKNTSKLPTYGIIIGIILVAIGIISTQLGGLPQIETFAAWWLAIFAMFQAGCHIYFSIKVNQNPKVSLYWSLAGLSLFMGMTLAGLYGMRHIWALPGLDIAWMRALHGSVNVFGFSLLAILGWRDYMK